MTEHAPSGLELLHVLRGHSEPIYEISWSPDGRWLASCSVDRSIRIWDVEAEEVVQALKGHEGAVLSVAWSRDGNKLVSGSTDRTVRLWDVRRGKLLRTLEDHSDKVYSVAWQPKGGKFASGSGDGTVRIWDSETRKLLRTFEVPPNEKVICVAWSPKRRGLLASGSSDSIVRIWDRQDGELQRLQGHSAQVNALAWEPQGRLIVSGSVDRSVRLWDATTGSNLSVLEGHTKNIECVRFSADGKLLASKSADQTVRLWWCNARVLVATLPEPVEGNFLGGLAFHPGGRMLATLGERERIIRIWRLDLSTLKTQAAKSDTRHYRNAKVVLVGDPSVGKSGLALRLRGEEFQATVSTQGRQVKVLESAEVTVPDGQRETREVILWDLGGQPGYRLVHQLHLHEAAVALLVFDSQDSSFKGVRYWDRALRQARSLSPDSSGPLVKFLVAARAENGVVLASRAKIDALIRELGFDRYFVTSSQQGWQIDKLRGAIRNDIEWQNLPQVSSTRLFHTIREFLLSSGEPGRLLVSIDEFFHSFCAAYPRLDSSENLRAPFDTCIGRLEDYGLVRRFSFGGGLLLLKPELLDSCASAVVIAAQTAEEPGVLGQADVLAGNFPMPGIKSFPPEQVKLFLRATVEELIASELVLREHLESGPYLVFPSEFCRDWPEAPGPQDKALSFAFEGPALNIYVTLVFRLAHSGSFAASMKRIWLNAVIFDTGSGECGLYLRQESEGKGELILFYAPEAPPSVRFRFEEFVKKHLQERSLIGTLTVRRFRICQCGEPLAENWKVCPVCATPVPAESAAELFPSVAPEMDLRAKRSQEYETWELAATAEIEILAVRPDATVPIVFTDVVGSTALQSEVGDERMSDIRSAHFRKVRSLVEKYKGTEIKTLGDGFLSAFPTAVAALEFALDLHCNTGHKRISVRTGIHVGVTTRLHDDIFGSAVNYAVRLNGVAAGAEIWLSDRACRAVEQDAAIRLKDLPWRKHADCEIKGMPGRHTLWSLPDIPCESVFSGLEGKLRAGSFDVFLCYNSVDRSAVQEIAIRLAARGILPWFDVWESRPGTYWQRVLEDQIESIQSAAVFVGKEGLGPWQQIEMDAFLREFVRRGCSVIPVLLPLDRSTRPELPLFLRGIVWVDFHDVDSDPLEQLIWGITGERPEL